MESLDTFRHCWQAELARDTSEHTDSTKDTPPGDLARIGINFKTSSSSACRIPAPLSLPQVSPFHCNARNGSFTIGIRTFISSNSKQLTNEPPTKRCKTSNNTLVDELIRDIDESTDIPFFNVSLPHEIGLRIFEYLSLKDLCSCSLVCKSWYSLSLDEFLWHTLYKRLKLHHPHRTSDQSWKSSVKEAILFNRQLVQNFKTHQCRTTKLSYRQGIVLTCANNNSDMIIAGYSAGIIRTWSIDAIFNIDEDDDDDKDLSVPDVIYESTDDTPSRVIAVGILKDDVYAIHYSGLLEIWKKHADGQPRFTQRIPSITIVHTNNDKQYLCAASPSRFFVWNFHQVNINDQLA